MITLKFILVTLAQSSLKNFEVSASPAMVLRLFDKTNNNNLYFVSNYNKFLQNLLQKNNINIIILLISLDRFTSLSYYLFSSRYSVFFLFFVC